MNIYFSVVLPAYNTPPDILRRAIRSVLNQTYPYFELIIVDDGSTPSLEPVVKEFNDERMVFICHEQNRGAGATHNTGIKVAKYDWIAFICHDDEWLPKKLEIQKDCITKFSDYKFFYSDEFVVEKGNTFLNKMNLLKFSQNLSDYENILVNGFLATSTIIIHKEVFDNVGYYDETGVLIDWDLYIRIFKKYKIYYIQRTLIYHYYSELGITYKNTIHKGDRVGNDIIKLFYKWGSEINKNRIAKKAWAIRWNSIGKYFYERKEIKKSFNSYLVGIKLNFFWKGNYIDLLKLIYKLLIFRL
jgi:glycosyltransferase involved in cell wall biosynthesis